MKDWINQDIDSVFLDRFPGLAARDFPKAIRAAKKQTVKRTLRPAQRELYKALFSKVKKPTGQGGKGFTQSSFTKKWMRAKMKSDDSGEVSINREITPTLTRWANRSSVKASMDQKGRPMKRRKRIKVEIYKGKKTTLGERYSPGKDSKSPFAREVHGNTLIMRRMRKDGPLAAMRVFDLREVLLRDDVRAPAVKRIEGGMRSRFRGILTGKLQQALERRLKSI